MPANELLLEGVRLMALGMGIVFTFLVMLVFVLGGMSRIAALIEARDGSVEAGNPPGAAPSAPQAIADQELIAVMGAAIARYRTSARRPKL